MLNWLELQEDVTMLAFGCTDLPMSCPVMTSCDHLHSLNPAYALRLLYISWPAADRCKAMHIFNPQKLKLRVS